MATIYDVNPNELIEKAAEQIKSVKEVQMPDWARYVKTGAHKERPPNQEDWWQLKAAAILRKVYTRGPIGVSKLRHIFGGKKNRGTKPERFRPAGGKVIRTILQQLEKAGLIKQTEKGVYKGKIVTPKGQSFLDNAVKVKGAKPKAEPKPKVKEAPKEKPKAEKPKEEPKNEQPTE